MPIAAIVALESQASLDGFLAIEKYSLVKRGVLLNAIQAPPILWTLDDETRAEVDRLFCRLQMVI